MVITVGVPGFPNRKEYYHGENNPCVKLTEEEIREVRARYKKGKDSMRYLAEVYGISFGGMAKILNKERWKHI